MDSVFEVLYLKRPPSVAGKTPRRAQRLRTWLFQVAKSCRNHLLSINSGAFLRNQLWSVPVGWALLKNALDGWSPKHAHAPLLDSRPVFDVHAKESEHPRYRKREIRKVSDGGAVWQGDVVLSMLRESIIENLPLSQAVGMKSTASVSASGLRLGKPWVSLGYRLRKRLGILTVRIALREVEPILSRGPQAGGLICGPRQDCCALGRRATCPIAGLIETLGEILETCGAFKD